LRHDGHDQRQEFAYRAGFVAPVKQLVFTKTYSPKFVARDSAGARRMTEMMHRTPLRHGQITQTPGISAKKSRYPLERLTLEMLAYGRQKPAYSHFVARIFRKILAEHLTHFIRKLL